MGETSVVMSARSMWMEGALARSRTPVMEPEEPYELEGFFGNVIFTNGHLVDGDRIALYYGASDKVICRADLSVGEILENLRKDL